ncbi:hypothetical protein [Desulfomicrobium escambiense]|uniref:hypothetical protein n=1 Tax=Desulfomicrobium escambiense TaxID=29503 RepID=UPI0004920E1F|nr:hypothetical protein [Desulfomicrobium escambiense]
MARDPFRLIDPPDDKDQLLKVAHLACQCREHGVNLVNVGGWILPLCALPWSPERATALRRTLHHVERCRGFLQAHSEAFPAMDRAEAEKWLADLHRIHGAGAWPCWWSKAVVGIAQTIINMVEA